MARTFDLVIGEIEMGLPAFIDILYCRGEECLGPDRSSTGFYLVHRCGGIITVCRRQPAYPREGPEIYDTSDLSWAYRSIIATGYRD